MKKRIGNDITFTWHIYRKSGETQVPESFTDKDVEVKLISPLQRPVTIEDVSIATGVVTFTLRGKHQVTLGNYVAVLQENKGEDGMVTLDVVNAVTLVAHSYMEEDGDEGDVIEAESVELTSTISAGGGGGIVQQQADWAQTDASAVDFIKHKPNLDEYAMLNNPNRFTETQVIEDDRYRATFTQQYIELRDKAIPSNPTLRIAINGIYKVPNAGTINGVVWEDTATSQIPAATTEANGLMSAEDKQKITDIEEVIPEQASSSNKLADKDFVNSSIATATATYRGSYNLVTDLHLTISATHSQIADALATKMETLSITPDNNDYCFVQIPTADATPTEIARIDRYKYDGTAWAYEYSLNNSSFTAAQWAAINSGITSGLVAKLSALPTNSELTALLSGKASTSELEEVAAGVAAKQDKMPIVQVASGATSIDAAINTYYKVEDAVNNMAITLPEPTDTTKVAMVVIHLLAGTTPNVVIGSTAVIDYSAAYDISAGKEYEINCLYNGDKWVVADMEVV